jgi:Mg2+ and Co2+ transporter CorA
MSAMDVVWVSEGAPKRYEARDLAALLRRDDGFVWVDVPDLDEETGRFLSETFGFHEMAVRACMERSHVPKVHGYADHLFLVLHAPEPDEPGHIHLLQLVQFIGTRYLVTVHGPLGSGVDVEPALRETRAILQKMDEGRYGPHSPAELSFAIVSRLTRHIEGLASVLATKVAEHERRVREEALGDPERVLEELFLARHELLTLRTMAAQGREICGRVLRLTRGLPPEAGPFFDDLFDQYSRLGSLCDQEKEFLQGVVDFYQSRATTRMNIAMERLALIAALLLPITAVASIYGMNLIVSEDTRLFHLAGVLTAMAVVTAVMLRWTRRRGWW